jgi:hypothetical protein
MGMTRKYLGRILVLTYGEWVEVRRFSAWTRWGLWLGIRVWSWWETWRHSAPALGQALRRTDTDEDRRP